MLNTVINISHSNPKSFTHLSISVGKRKSEKGLTIINLQDDHHS